MAWSGRQPFLAISTQPFQFLCFSRVHVPLIRCLLLHFYSIRVFPRVTTAWFEHGILRGVISHSARSSMFFFFSFLSKFSNYGFCLSSFNLFTAVK
jgi:hypothetical protein